MFSNKLFITDDSNRKASSFISSQAPDMLQLPVTYSNIVCVSMFLTTESKAILNKYSSFLVELVKVL